jgi:saccharopine dehydrogenase-like NADP-dependent oxidoreductase
LPAPADNDNPLGYKFSWAPRGVLLAAKNDATFLRDGATVTIPAGALYDNVESFEVPGVGTFDGYGNRNSNNYISVYNIPETKTIIRGTFRYDGWCKTLRKLLDLGYLNIEPLNGGALVGKTYAEFTAALLGKNDTATLKADIAAKLGLSVDDKLIQNFEWLGLLGADTIKDAAPIDALVTAMLPRMQYTENQRDMIFMQHKLRVEYSAEKKAKTILYVT